MWRNYKKPFFFKHGTPPVDGPFGLNATLNETITITDTLVKDSTKALSEVITVTDTITKTLTKALSEVITLTETMIKDITKSLTESITVTDTFSKMVTKVFNETVTITASLGSFILDSMNRGSMELRRYFKDEVPKFFSRGNNKPTEFSSHGVEKPKLR